MHKQLAKQMEKDPNAYQPWKELLQVGKRVEIQKELPLFGEYSYGIITLVEEGTVLVRDETSGVVGRIPMDDCKVIEPQLGVVEKKKGEEK